MTIRRRDFLTMAAGAPIATGPIATGIAKATQYHSEDSRDSQQDGAAASSPAPDRPTQRKGRVKHSACRWCYGSMSVDALCKEMAAMGGHSIELLDEKEWAIPTKYGLTCAVANGPGSIGHGWNRVENHEKLIREFQRMLPLCKEAGIPNLITFSGNRRGIADDEGRENCKKGLLQVVGAAEKAGVTIIMELLNSKVDHHDYQCDHVRWGADLVKSVGSPRFKLLFDIYHMQIMDGDVIRNIRDHFEYIAHFHTGGVPGRAEIDESQELNYPAICRAIVDLKYQGYISQEFCPTKDPMTSLRRAIDICDV